MDEYRLAFVNRSSTACCAHCTQFFRTVPGFTVCQPNAVLCPRCAQGAAPDLWQEVVALNGATQLTVVDALRLACPAASPSRH